MMGIRDFIARVLGRPLPSLLKLVEDAEHDPKHDWVDHLSPNGDVRRGPPPADPYAWGNRLAFLLEENIQLRKELGERKNACPN